jgi:hypothetical protein
VIEIVAAVLSAALGGVGTTAVIVNSRSRENREIVIRLTVAVENVAQRLEELHEDIRVDRREVQSRITQLEQRTARLEGTRQ